MAYPCFPGPSCSTCTESGHIWGPLVDNNSYCCFKDAESIDEQVKWLIDDPNKCPEDSIDWATNIKAFFLGLFFVVVVLMCGWAYLRWEFLRVNCRRMMFPPARDEADSDSGSGGSSFEASTTDSNQEVGLVEENLDDPEDEFGGQNNDGYNKEE